MSAWLGFLPNVSSHCRTVTICVHCHDNIAGYFSGVSTIGITFIVEGKPFWEDVLIGQKTRCGARGKAQLHYYGGDLPGASVPRIERWQASSRGAHGVEQIIEGTVEASVIHACTTSTSLTS